MSRFDVNAASSRNMTTSGTIAPGPTALIGFEVNSTGGGTIALMDGQTALSGTITPAVGFHRFPATFGTSALAYIDGTINVTFFYAAMAGSGLANPYPDASFFLPLGDLGNGRVDTSVWRGTGSATFTRATTATTVNSSGQIVSVASGVARSYYDPSTLAYMGYLAEGARTNLALRSEEFDNASWVKTDTTATANSIPSPDGATTADLLTEGSAGTAQVAQGIAIASNSTNTVSYFFKAGNTSWVRLTILESAASANRVSGWFNLSTGVVGTASNGGTGTGAAISMVAYPNGWYRCILSGAVNNAATNISITVSSASADNSTTRVNGATYYAWGAQLEAGSFASSYIPTTTASVTRNADVLTYTFSGNADATVGTTYAELSFASSTNAGGSTAVAVGFQNAAAGIMLLGNAATTITAGDGTNLGTKTGLSSMFGNVRKRGLSWGSSTMLITGDGLTPQSVTFDGNIGSTAIAIGSDSSGTRNWFGTLKNVRIWQTQFTDAQLQLITA